MKKLFFKLSVFNFLMANMLFFYSCNNKKQSAQCSDSQLTVQVLRADLENESLTYNVRIFPKKELLSGDNSFSKNMIYHTDSCFYLLNGQVKLFPLSVEFIPNGIANSFEYLIQFEKTELKNPSKSAIQLVYQDKYINHKKYQLLLK